MDFFNQGIPLGRWFKITVVLHWTFLLYAAFELFGSRNLLFDSIFLALLFGTVLMHEFGHALSCQAVGGQAFHIVLWPLGGIAFVQPPMNPRAWLITTLCGPLVNAVLWPLFWAINTYLLPQLAPPFGVESSLALKILIEGCLYMQQINMVLLLFNLIPAYPMDGGRLLQEILWFFIGYPRSLQIAGMVGSVCGLAFVVLGLGMQQITLPYLGNLGGSPSGLLLVIGILVCFESFNIYKRSQEIKGWRKN